MSRRGLDMVNSASMFSLNYKRWYQLTGGYKTPFDPRPALAKLSKLQDEVGAWEELWEELHHQGDVGGRLLRGDTRTCKDSSNRWDR